MGTRLPYEILGPACRSFGETLRLVGEGDWARPTPCADWNVRELVNHLVSENVWVAPLLAGSTIAEVGTRFDGDLLGEDPIGAWSDSARQAVEAAEELADMSTVVHLSYGDESAGQYLNQLATDYVIHRWDLATALGQSTTLDPEMVEIVSSWFGDYRAMYLAAGVIAEAIPVADDADAQTALLASFGRASP